MKDFNPGWLTASVSYSALILGLREFDQEFLEIKLLRPKEVESCDKLGCMLITYYNIKITKKKRIFSRLATGVRVLIKDVCTESSSDIIDAPLTARWAYDGDLPNGGKTSYENQCRSIASSEVSTIGIYYKCGWNDDNINKDGVFESFVYLPSGDRPKIETSQSKKIWIELQAVGQNSSSKSEYLLIDFDKTENNFYKVEKLGQTKEKKE